MGALQPCSIRLTSASHEVESIFTDRDVRVLRPPTRERLRNIFLSTYRWETRKDRLEGLFRGISLPDNPLVLNTGGAYHHLTYGIVSSLDPPGGIAYVHIDNHADAQDVPEKSGENVLHSSFTPDIAGLPGVSSVVTVEGYHPSFETVPAERFVEGAWEERLEQVLDRAPERVYVSVDLDVFHQGYCDSEFSQGVLNWSQFEAVVTRLQDEKEVVGADIVGINPSSGIDRSTYRAVGELLLGSRPGEDYLRSVQERLEKSPDSFHFRCARELSRGEPLD